VNYLTAENITKTYGEKVLFSNISLHINKGQKVALVARNGAGKSTLLRVLSEQESPEGEKAKLMIRRDIRVGILEQDPEFYGRDTIIEAVFDANNPMLDAIKEYETALNHQDDQKRFQAALARMEDLKAWDIEAKVKEILFKLDIQRLEDPVDILSGGQKKRLALAKLLIEEPDFLILDEPTNHLDLEMIEWLEEYLQQPNRTLLMVTHDRYFLDRVCDTIVELDGGQLFRYKGNYTDFLEKKATREEVEARTLERDKKLFTKELDWVRRMPKARGTKAKARVEKFEDLKEKVSGKVLKEEVQMDIKGARLGGKILELHSICKAYDELVIVDNFFYKFKKKERVGIVGPNGAGKTTFLKMLTKEIRPDHGKVVVGGTVKFGYFTQSGIQLKEDKRVIDVVRDVAEFIPLEKGQKLTAPQLLERFMFSRAQQQVYVSQLSGGERRRLHLLTILMTNPNFLILDEPTNDLDIITLNVLEEFLMDFPGCLVIVSHDRYFMDKIVDHLFIFEGKGKIRDFNGKYTEYRLIRREEEQERKRQEAGEKEQESTASKTVEKKEKRKLSYHEQVEFSQLEKDIEKLESRKAEIFGRFNDPEISSEEIEKLSIEVSEIKEQLEEKELRWMELAEFA
jgi:ATP-binding cassette subfamily F protein uup